MDDPTKLFEFFRPEGIVSALITLLLTWSAGQLLSRAFGSLGDRFPNRRLLFQQVKSILRLVVFVGGTLLAITFLFRLSQEALIALGGTLAVALGFAFKDLLASMIAGVIILVDRPFQVGDRVAFGDYYGEVTEIGLRTVRLVTLDDSLITIPNNKFLTDAVSSGNAGALDMLIETNFIVGLDQDLARAKQLIGEAVVTSRYAYLEKKWSVVLSPKLMGDVMGVQMKAKVYVIDVKYEKALQSDITERVLSAFNREGIRAPGLLINRANPVQTIPTHGTSHPASVQTADIS